MTEPDTTAATSTILVPLDLGTEADRALPVAAALAAGLGGHVDAVTVTCEGVDPDEDQQEARAHAEAVGVALRSVRLRYDADDVAGALLAEAASDGATLCLATHARSPAGELLLHPVSQELVRRAGVPVVMVGPRAGMAGSVPARVVVCVGDGDPAMSARVVETGAAWAHWLRADAVVVHATPPWWAEAGGEPVDVSGIETALRDQGLVVTTRVVATTDPAEAVVAMARRGRQALVVMGAHQRSGRRSALGSVTRHVIHESPCPVLVVPPTGT